MPVISSVSSAQSDNLAAASNSLINLIGSFNGTSANGINNLTSAIQSFANTSSQILSVEGLANTLLSLDTVADTSSTKISGLISNLYTLTNSFNALGFEISTNPTAALNQISSSLTDTAYQVQAAWDALTLEFSSTVTALQQAVTNMNVTGSLTVQPGTTIGLGETETQSLAAIATNTQKFAYLTATGRDKYSVGTYASGGFVGRDRVLSLLEPGEFVLKKTAVEKLGVDNALKLNATGNINSSGDVQVNITNNGAPVEVAATPDVRRVNGKIVVDILLEDLRNNGPIKRQIRSLR